MAPRFSRTKPLVAVKSGRSAAGARATSSHTGALVSASDVTVDALFEQAGVIRTDTLKELFDVAALLSAQPIPRGDRVAIVANAGGPGIMCADACQANGVQVPALPRELRAELAAFLPPTASLANPIDMIATASAEHYRRTLRTLAAHDVCDAILAIFVPPLGTRASDVAAAIREVAETTDATTIAAVFMTSEGAPAELRSQRVHVPGYEYPEDAARAIALAASHGRWRSRPGENVPGLMGARPEEAAAIISRQLSAGPGWLPPAQAAAVLECYGLPLITTRIVTDADEAVAAAADLGGAVALKASAPGLVHKTDAGGVLLGLESAADIRAGADEIGRAIARAGLRLDGLIVQPMAPAGLELVVGVVNDHSFGQVLACGAGGTTAELIKDVAVRITPVTDLDAHDMLRSLRTFPLLDGYRGAPRCNIAAIEDVLVRLSALVDRHEEIVELDCNPLIARPDGAVIVDARVRVEAAPPRAPMPSVMA